ncbi:hypothetical protein BAUCODRAFT_158092 [Baudoinia panamericana UAMH 10762]|uniref:Integral membrane protein n=1 Tax=Baudoinia panamericana (strain UAMH 10762) TaxID=717646 RepID=M2N6W3_BAUPA|nr:uncharacterized protein BAUCODRAFT_158092 [Baudoinia panamericana UAMH 10762]EMC94505.1 hypothetical protein BAUCODRAFT_158092 [Baudoinia panamericana UAMH 10762]
MGKAGRIACIFTPWALTIASFVCLILIEVSGWGSKGTFNSFYFMEANFTNLTTASASTLQNTTTLTAALELAKSEGKLSEIYQVHLWNYCSSKSSDGDIDYCSPKTAHFYFDPIAIWALNGSNATSTSGSGSNTNAITTELSKLQNNTEKLENEMLGKSGQAAVDAYRHVAIWMFIAYEISFWTTLATIVCGILAIFSRIGSFLTWLCSIASTLFTFAAVLTSTILFAALTGALQGILHPYGVKLSLGTQALTVTWLAVAFSLAATLFWLFSVCWCSGRSNPHHRSNKGGLWNAEPKGQGYGDYSRGRGLRVEKTGGYERVSSPVWGGADVPLHDYSQRGHSSNPSGAFESMRHHQGA